MKIQLVCPHGFSYVSYQRVEVLVDDIPSPSTAAEIVRLANTVQDDIEGAVYRDGNNLFVISGESFSLCDFAEAVKSMLSDHFSFVEVSYQDGDEEMMECL